jgi:hypothetical protein
MEQGSKSTEFFYLISAVAGVIFTMYFNIQFVLEHGVFSLSTFIAENYVNNGSASIANYFIIVGLVFLVWSFQEAKCLQMRKWWLFFLVSFSVALAFTMPLFMLLRERRIAALSGHQSV